MVMPTPISITGTLVNSYTACPRQACLFSRRIEPSQDHPYLEMGRVIDETTYTRERRRIAIDGGVIDLIQRGEEYVLVGEVKKSSKSVPHAFFQVLYYLYRLKEQGITARGLIAVPDERKRFPVDLTAENEAEIRSIIEDIETLVHLETPPPAKKVAYCSHCSFLEFCFA
ncbi:CRISPR-associated protein Cas4 [Methanofollis fontis]|uniref:CRISPR-associated exonuclease Cas4 n=1 Tax=Methanofollis fontis TaxID=2052832 RepID=A0A483CUJ9_9EURY|nr:CRISPR-associated protein Cas4 [Methanofollis fontis]TAJ44998.1 CRISPR-associated protein Cas4 [Methanofollis fontis]